MMWMRRHSPAYETLVGLLGRREDDPSVAEVIGGASAIRRVEDQGYAELKSSGVSVMFKMPAASGSKRALLGVRPLRVYAIHLHRNRHERYAEYTGKMPGGITFDDSETKVVEKLGKPAAAGGGGISSVLHRPIPKWIRYLIDGQVLHVQLDVNGYVEMVTVYEQGIGVSPEL